MLESSTGGKLSTCLVAWLPPCVPTIKPMHAVPRRVFACRNLLHQSLPLCCCTVTPTVMSQATGYTIQRAHRQ